MVDLGDRVLGPAPGAEAVADRLEVRLEHRLQHQHERSLHQPVHRGRYAQAPELPALARLGNQALPHRQRRERPGFQLLPGRVQERQDIGVIGDEGRDHPVHPRGASSLVAPHPGPGHREEARVTDEVEQIIEPAAGIIGRPPVQLGLHPPYPALSLIQARHRLTSIHQRLQSLQYLTCANPLDPFAMQAAFPPPDYYGSSVPPAAMSGRRAVPLPGSRPLPGQTGTAGGSHVHHEPFDR
jgi:hypothetical protein